MEKVVKEGVPSDQWTTPLKWGGLAHFETFYRDPLRP